MCPFTSVSADVQPPRGDLWRVSFPSHCGGCGQRAAPSWPLPGLLCITCFLPGPPVQGEPFLGYLPIAEENSPGAPCGCTSMEGQAL